MVSLRSLALLTGASLSAAFSQPNSTETETNIISGAFIVEFEGDQTSETLYGELRSQHGLDVAPRLDMQYKLFSGASFTIKGAINAEDAAATIASSPRVKNVWPVTTIAVPDDNLISVGQSNIAQVHQSTSKRAVGNFTYDPHVMTQVDLLHDAGYTGKGIKIGIVDSGVDYNHPDLGGCFGPGCLVSYGYDLIGGPYLGQGSGPDEDPMDECFGHGTHVAGIIAAQPNAMGFLGVAPDAELGAYRAIDCMGMSSNDILIAAFNMAYEDGSDIITASLGMDGGWPDDAWSLAAQRIVEAGVPVLVAAGNSGETGLFNPSNPSSGRGVASVASVDTREYPFLLLAGTYDVDGEEAGEFGWIAGFPAIENVTLPLYYLGGRSSSNGTAVDGCSAIPDDIPSLAEVVVLVEEKPCSEYIQAENIAAKGGKYILFFGDSEEPGSANPMNYDILGVGTTTSSQAKLWIEDFDEGRNITVSLNSPDVSGQIVSFSPNTVSPGYTSSFTSWGPNWDLSVNPSLAAPGARILSTFPLRLGSYSVQEGTSMACPFAAGVTALVAQARGTFDPETLRAVLASTSMQLVFHNGDAADSQGRLAPVPQGGAGLIQGWDAANAKTVVSRAVISFNDTDHLPSEVKLSILNLGDEETTYVLGNSPALTMYSFMDGSTRLAPFPNDIASDASAELDFAASEVTVSAGKSVEITVECTPPGAVDASRLPIYSGFLTLNSSQGESLAIPYLGAAASMRDDTQIFYISNVFGMFLGRFGDRWPMPLEANTLFSIPRPTNATDPLNPGNFGRPEARITTNIGIPAMRLDVVASNCTALELPKTKWQGHNSLGQLPGFPMHHLTFGGFRGSFAGVLADGTIVPEGRYQFVVSALKIFGNPAEEDDWEVFEFVPFVLEYLDG